jgi:hypothetical protein
MKPRLLVCLLAVFPIIIASAADSAFVQIDLRPYANADPLSEEELYGERISPRGPGYVWVEGESFFRKKGASGIETRAAASGGKVLGDGFGARAGDWAEWSFDMPFASAKGVMILRVARTEGNATARLRVARNGEAVGNVWAPLTGGRGDVERDFSDGVLLVEIGPLPMGRQIFRVTTAADNDLTGLDGFWIGAEPLDVVNCVDTGGRMHAPASRGALAYTPGTAEAEGVPFSLIDPRVNGGKGVYSSGKEPLIINIPEQTGAWLHLLGGGLPEKTEIQARCVYGDGQSQENTFIFGPLFTKEPANPALSLGVGRHAYVVSVELNDAPLNEVRIEGKDGQYVLLGATLERP